MMRITGSALDAPSTRVRSLRRSRPPADAEHVVTVDQHGRPAGMLPKATVHDADTPLHLAFSCHVFRRDGAVLLTQRAATKATWPGVWTNACCGHPQSAETLRSSITRRLRDELGLRPAGLRMVIPDFVYRAEMPGGPVEHELCPVVAAIVDDDPRLEPDEVGNFAWVSWTELVDRARSAPETLSPWAVLQVGELDHLGFDPTRWLAGADAPDGLDALLDGAPDPGPRIVANGHDALGDVTGAVEQLLATVLDGKRRDAVAVDGGLAEVVDELSGLILAGGKRLRPAFVYWGHRATGAEHDERVFRAAAAVELLHTFALVHDDVMDRADLRRGRPSVHRALAGRHVRFERLGSSDWFGVSAAMLAGDLAFVWADEQLTAGLHESPAASAARAVFDLLRNEVMAGQYLDLLLAADRNADEWSAVKVAMLKSARYTVTRPLQLGAAIGDPAGASRTAEALAVYGDAVGLAFQLRDDVLGLFGDPVTTGKSTLEDLREGKRTLLVVRAMRLATPAQRRVLDANVGRTELDDDGADRVREIVAATGSLASIESLIDAKLLVAGHALQAIDGAAREPLSQLARRAIDRTC